MQHLVLELKCSLFICTMLFTSHNHHFLNKFQSVTPGFALGSCLQVYNLTRCSMTSRGHCCIRLHLTVGAEWEGKLWSCLLPILCLCPHFASQRHCILIPTSTWRRRRIAWHFPSYSELNQNPIIEKQITLPPFDTTIVWPKQEI